MTTNEHNGHLAASRIEVEPTELQRAGYALAEAFGSPDGVDWVSVESSFSALTGASGYDIPLVEQGRSAAVRINEALLSGRQPTTADLDSIRYALAHAQGVQPLPISDGIPIRYWQSWLIENWLPSSCVGMLTGDGGVGKSRLALQLAWALSGAGRWLGEAGQMPVCGCDYGMGFEALGPRKVMYATWEDSPEQIRGRLYWIEQSGKIGNGNNFKIADMRALGHLWAVRERNAVPGLTPAGEMLRATAEQEEARLLVVDTLGVANGASEIDRAQVGAFFADWAAWADASDCAVLLIAHPPKTAGVAYSGSTGILGGVRAMWTIESVKRDCRGSCGSPKSCTCQTAYAYRLVNAKQNYSQATGSVWLTNERGVWLESPGRTADYGDSGSTQSDKDETDAADMFQDAL
jgi:hypothetical protein